MWKLKGADQKLLIYWVILYISISCVLTLIFCELAYLTFFYHLLLIPIYGIIAWLLLVGFNVVNKRKPKYAFFFFWFMIITISISLKDFRYSFGLYEYSTHEFSFTRLIRSGCLEMYFFLSLIMSSSIVTLWMYNKRVKM